jgi:hypothetical protein
MQVRCLAVGMCATLAALALSPPSSFAAACWTCGPCCVSGTGAQSNCADVTVAGGCTSCDLSGYFCAAGGGGGDGGPCPPCPRKNFRAKRAPEQLELLTGVLVPLENRVASTLFMGARQHLVVPRTRPGFGPTGIVEALASAAKIAPSQLRLAATLTVLGDASQPVRFLTRKQEGFGISTMRSSDGVQHAIRLSPAVARTGTDASVNVGGHDILISEVSLEGQTYALAVESSAFDSGEEGQALFRQALTTVRQDEQGYAGPRSSVELGVSSPTAAVTQPKSPTWGTVKVIYR